MPFIPQKLKDIFKRKAKPETAAPAPVISEAVAPAPEVAKAFEAATSKVSPYAQKRLAAMERYKNADGHYEFKLDISSPGNGKPDSQGRQLFMITSREADLYLALITAQPLAGVNTMAASFQETLEKNTGLKNAGIFLRLRGSDFYIDCRDEYIGLDATPGFQLVVVPEGSEKQPKAPLPRIAPKDSCALLRLPSPPPQFRGTAAKQNGPVPKRG